MTGMPAASRVGDRLGQRLRFLGADDEEVHFGADKFLDLRALLECIVLGVLENDLQFGMFGGGGGNIGVHLHAPRLAEIALRHADDKLRGFGQNCARRCLSLPEPARFVATGYNRRGHAKAQGMARVW